jgi:pyridoxine 4-dehydrogenase
MEITTIMSVQNSYSVLNRGSEEVLEFCEEQGIMFIPYFPIGGNRGSFEERTLEWIARKHNATSRQVGLIWLLQHSPVIVPIPGTGNVTHVEENMKALGIKLDTEDIAALDVLAP